MKRLFVISLTEACRMRCCRIAGSCSNACTELHNMFVELGHEGGEFVETDSPFLRLTSVIGSKGGR